jgi:hypothetical protein
LTELRNLGETAADDLVNALASDPDPEIRSNVCQAMETLPSERVLTALMDALSDPNDEVRGSASSALRELRDVQAVPALRNALERETGHFAREAQESALRALTQTEKSPVASPHVRRWEFSDAKEATRSLFEEALPGAGMANLDQVEEKFLPWQMHSGNATVCRGERDEMRVRIMADLEHMQAERGFRFFRVGIVVPQNAVEVKCFMDAQSRYGSEVFVPIRMWCGATTCIVSGLDSWK